MSLASVGEVGRATEKSLQAAVLTKTSNADTFEALFLLTAALQKVLTFWKQKFDVRNWR